jgi:hypothetical protein
MVLLWTLPENHCYVTRFMNREPWRAQGPHVCRERDSYGWEEHTEPRNRERVLNLNVNRICNNLYCNQFSFNDCFSISCCLPPVLPLHWLCLCFGCTIKCIAFPVCLQVCLSFSAKIRFDGLNCESLHCGHWTDESQTSAVSLRMRVCNWSGQYNMVLLYACAPSACLSGFFFTVPRTDTP